MSVWECLESWAVLQYTVHMAAGWLATGLPRGCYLMPGGWMWLPVGCIWQHRRGICSILQNMVLSGKPRGSLRADMGHLRGCIWLPVGCIWLHRGCICSIWQYTLHMAAGWLAGHRGPANLRGPPHLMVK